MYFYTTPIIKQFSKMYYYVYRINLYIKYQKGGWLDNIYFTFLIKLQIFYYCVLGPVYKIKLTNTNIQELLVYYYRK